MAIPDPRRPSSPGSFGALLKRYRRLAGLTQERLAARSGYSSAYVSMLERNVRTPLPATIAILSEALALAPDDQALLLAALYQPPISLAAQGHEMRESEIHSLDAIPTGEADGASVSAPWSRPSLIPLVGRRRELLHVERLLAGRGPPTLLLAGEPGIGKTRLLNEVVSRAREQGWTVLQGGCHRRSGQDPYAPWPETLGRFLEACSPFMRRQSLRGCAWLVRLLPELIEITQAPMPLGTLPPEQERRLLFAAVSRLLTNIAGSRGTLLALDDLQWMGADGVDLLGALARLPETRITLVGAYRSSEIQPGEPLPLLLSDLIRADLATWVPLERLSEEEAGNLFASLIEGRADSVDEHLIARILERADGAPYFLVSYARGLQSGALRLAEAVDGAEGTISAPMDVAETIRQRIAVLPAAARDILGLAAVIGREISPALLLEAARAVLTPSQVALQAVEATCAAGLLSEVREQGAAGYRFSHDLVREVVESDLSAARQTVFHATIAHILEQRQPAAVERLARLWPFGGREQERIS
jgi:predicted ATPase